jgi:hypothetical protein
MVERDSAPVDGLEMRQAQRELDRLLGHLESTADLVGPLGAAELSEAVRSLLDALEGTRLPTGSHRTADG